MWATVAKIGKALLLAKNKKSQNITKKVVIAFLSPAIALVLLIGGIYSDGIQTNHSLIQDLFEGIEISKKGLSVEQAQHLEEIESGLRLINDTIDQMNESLEEGHSLNVYLVKGYYIGLMFTEQKIVLDEEKSIQWVKAFTQEEILGDTIHKIAITDSSKIFKNMNENIKMKLEKETQDFMIEVSNALLGGYQQNTPTTSLSKEEIENLIKMLPENTSELRKNIVIQAADAAGKIPYYWGGAASVPGYQGNDFGKPIAPDEHGRTLKGMDCSHFVDWVYWTIIGNNLGNTNTTGQIKQCIKISQAELLPGDLAFLIEADGSSSHVGIYAGRNTKGEAVWIHENAADNNVSVNTVSYWNLYCRLNIMQGK